MVGATGYAGAELIRLLAGHPEAEVGVATSARAAGDSLAAHAPWLDSDLRLIPFDPAADCDVFFLCQEAGFAMEHADPLLGHAKVVDLSADFRLSDAALYEKTYGRAHAAPSHLPAVYGLVEANREAIAGANLVANPGCYPTCSLLALLPLVRSGLIPEGAIPVIDAKSGVSGAGRSRSETAYTFSELSGGFKAYATTGHRHVPEIEEHSGVKVRFTPHLVPMARGLEATLHVPIQGGRREIEDAYREAYANEPFLRLVDSPPSTKQVLGSNRCDLFWDFDERIGYAVATSVIDNLVKGAAGQAVQNMNVMFGLSETLGLPKNGVWP